MAMPGTERFLLKPNQSLLNPNFEAYKLYSEAGLTVYSKLVEYGLPEFKLDAGYLYTRLTSLHNHLFHDPFENECVYFFNTRGHLLMYTLEDVQSGLACTVWQGESMETKELSDNCLRPYPSSVHFPSCDYAVVSNGCGSITLSLAENRRDGRSWVTLHESTIASGMIVHSMFSGNAEMSNCDKELHILLLSVISPEELKNDPLHTNFDWLSGSSSYLSSFHMIHWLTLTKKDNQWKLLRNRRLVGGGSLEYVCLAPSCHKVILLSHEEYHFVYDSQKHIAVEKKKPDDDGKTAKCIFSQTSDDLTIWIRLEPEVKKDDLNVKISACEFKVIVKGESLLERKFMHRIDCDTFTWTIDNGQLEVTVTKSIEGSHWDSLFEGAQGDEEEVEDESSLEEIQTKLAHLTSENWANDPESEKPAYNPGELESCDLTSEDSLLLILDGEEHQCVRKAILGPVQHLFNTQTQSSLTPSFCLRHDVDGLLYEVGSNDDFEHTTTFDAFGYVKASKTMAKFTKAPSDNSYVAIADVQSHIYVFYQSRPLGSELRNRKRGTLTTNIAQQLILSLKNHDPVMGIHCTPKAIFVLTNTHIFLYSLPDNV